jgi:hypothetical protein
MLHKLRIALAASMLALTAAYAVDAASAADAPEFGFDVSAQRWP